MTGGVGAGGVWRGGMGRAGPGRGVWLGINQGTVGFLLLSCFEALCPGILLPSTLFLSFSSFHSHSLQSGTLPRPTPVRSAASVFWELRRSQKPC